MNPSPFKDKKFIKYQRLLYILMGVLVFEGLMRKMVPQSVGTLIFFLKDFISIYALYLIAIAKLPSAAKWINARWKTILLLLVPSLLYTASLDLPLSLFAAKQYLLYIVVGLLVPVAFSQSHPDRFKRFTLFLAALVVPTTMVAVLQNSLPSSHWLNLTVGGESLQGFAAGGFLRVSSTFSFTGQYSWFLNAVCAFLLLEFFLPSFTKTYLKWFVPGLFGICFLIGIFITGGRTAVIGSGACLFIGFVLASWKAPSLTMNKGAIAGAIMVVSLLLVRSQTPQFFAAYDKRSSGREDRSHSEEITGRVLEGFTDWTTWFWEQEPIAILLGNGLGVMSNGSDKVSFYAYIIRSTGFWTEGDTATVAWEGGLYLLVVWYVFRFIVILYCFNLWRSIKNIKYGVGSAFLLSSIIITGATGTISIQPPIAIWWWLSVGALIVIKEFDKNSLAVEAEISKKKKVDLQMHH